MDLNDLLAGKCVTCADRRLAGREREFLREVQAAMVAGADTLYGWHSGALKRVVNDGCGTHHECSTVTLIATLRRLAGERKE